MIEKAFKPLVITGSHPQVCDDINGLPKIGYDFMAIGLDAVNKYHHNIKYCATYHPIEIPEIKERRRVFGGNTDFLFISHEERAGVDICIKDWWQPSGSSALLGAQAALRIGYTRIVLCGCPLAGSNGKHGAYDTFRQGWIKVMPAIKPYVRSMSGWTMERLGVPTQEWLNGDQDG